MQPVTEVIPARRVPRKETAGHGIVRRRCWDQSIAGDDSSLLRRREVV